MIQSFKMTYLNAFLRLTVIHKNLFRFNIFVRNDVRISEI